MFVFSGSHPNRSAQVKLPRWTRWTPEKLIEEMSFLNRRRERDLFFFFQAVQFSSEFTDRD